MILKTILTALTLAAVFLVGLPWLLFVLSANLSWATVRLGPFRYLGFIAIGLGGCLYVVAALRLLAEKVAPIPGARPSRLTTEGPYGMVRNPMLLGVLLILAGEAVAFESAVLGAYAATYWIGLQGFLISVEEPQLRRAFGVEYERYVACVPRWIPRFTLRVTSQ